MNTTLIDVSTIERLTHAEAMRLQAAELDRTLDLLRSFEPADWSRPTICPDWDVRQMFLHVLGACDAGASMRENAHQMLAAKRRQKAEAGPLEANLSAVQVAERAELTPTELVDRLAATAPATVRGRTRMPGLLRRITTKVDGPVVERWSLGYLVDTIYLRDLWMHRVDAARATGRPLVLDADHDGRIVADVVAEWARRHGSPFVLTLTGPAGGTFTVPGGATVAGPGVEELELDAVDFCLALAGRVEAAGLLATVVPF